MGPSDRLRRNFKWISAGVGLPIIFLICPIEWFGWAFFVFVQLIDVIDERLNPRPRSHTGPLLPWSQMHAGDRLEYFFPALSITVAGVLIVSIILLASNTILESWIPLAFGLLVTAYGAGIAYGNWRNRWGTLDTE